MLQRDMQLLQHWQKQALLIQFLLLFTQLTQEEGGLVLIQPPGSHPT